MPEDNVVELWRELALSINYKGIYCFEVGVHRCNRLWLNGEGHCLLFNKTLRDDNDKVLRCDSCRKYFGE